ncbi:ATP-binding cassette sub-family C member 5-like [Biomphalaria glabrata]|uniref:ATP-binding cassette sub-family C member 5-like n=2 Tax=Biomphalaria glabrata TaxID=6526 RepID=A0A9W3B6L5_BIOGL|nr:ATP-binding cassette sub-family C member 5-like [Biomphalaria glabrata]XP_055895110.1 ATP-binding cassette sub-family C member 5-like [Biomphalaria glabrata]XP_055895111.1 ATP-binding cassette sub-family C member 5-like [Biomphalaria glabrata]
MVTLDNGGDRSERKTREEEEEEEEDRRGSAEDVAASGDAHEVFLHTPPDEDGLSTQVRGARGVRRYRNALKTFFPVRRTKPPQGTLPLGTVGLLNYVTFGWMTSYLWRIYKQGVGVVQGLQISAEEKSDTNAIRMEKFWSEELKLKGPDNASYFRAVFRSFKTRLLIGLFTSLVYAFLTLANPIIVIQYFLSYISNEPVSLRSGIGYAFAIGLVQIAKGLVDSFFWEVNIQAAIRIKYGCLAQLYSKVLRLKSLQDKTAGNIINFIGNDGQRIYDGVMIGPFIMASPIIIVAGCIYCVVYLGPWALVSCLIIVLFYPFAGVFAKLSEKFREASIKITDQRIGLLNELLTSIKLIKMYVWEQSFAQQIVDIRAQEKSLLEKSVFVLGISMGSSMTVSLFASSLAFIGYVCTGNNLTPTQAFTFVSLLSTMQSVMMTIPFSLKCLGEMAVTVKRLQEILLMSEMSTQLQQPRDNSLALEITNASFSWTSKRKKDIGNGAEVKAKAKKVPEETPGEDVMLNTDQQEEDQIFSGPSLSGVNLQIKKGQLVGICGSVGSGKSSLISAILGRMELTSGSVAVSSHVAYVSQQVWVTNDTIRDNIVFGHAYDSERYKMVVEACGLTPDFRAFPKGDMSEVGERGCNLSGGQKQRLSLARAAYSYCDLILLDDPLSAVDVHTAHHIFRSCVQGVMRDRTVVLVTHHLQYLKDCNKIIVLREGAVVEQGSHEELVSLSGEYAALLTLVHRDNESTPAENSPVTLPKMNSSEDNSAVSKSPHENVNVTSESLQIVPQEVAGNAGTLIQEETIQRESLSFFVFQKYIQAMGGVPVFILVIFCFSLPVANTATAGWYLTYWLQQASANTTLTFGNITQTSSSVAAHPDLPKFLAIYGAFLPLALITLIIKCIALMKTTLAASSRLHDSAFVQVLHSTIHFFDSTPVGRIVNRFSGDLDEVDSRLPMNADIFLTQVLQIVAAVAMMGYVMPWFLLAVLPLAIITCLLMIVFHKCVHELKYLDNVTRSPVVSHMGASLEGLAVIHAYKKDSDFMHKYCDLLNTNAVAVLMFYAANRWLALRTDFVSGILAFVIVVLLLVTSIRPELAGLALSYTVQLSSLFQFTARMAVETEARFSSVQRLVEYCQLKDLEPVKDESNKQSADWPTQGTIKFDNVKLRYRKNTPLALKGVSFQVQGHKKIGIVGRTGAGKTSLSAALFRLVELESGHVTVDNIDIATVALSDLRSRLSIIPQDPVLFSGTLRYNLDPFHQFSDPEIWQALEKCHVAQMVRTLDHQLDSQVLQSGSNFSVGEKQLLCLVRAVLRGNKILILDEATASIDSETDALLQQTLREGFQECTMLIIAHRLNTVLDCDLVLVLQDGHVVEYDSPSQLLSNPTSVFKSMLEATNTLTQTVRETSLS